MYVRPDSESRVTLLSRTESSCPFPAATAPAYHDRNRPRRCQARALERFEHEHRNFTACTGCAGSVFGDFRIGDVRPLPPLVLFFAEGSAVGSPGGFSRSRKSRADECTFMIRIDLP